eukprot:PhF_6_TR42121/c0_g1_i1/m.63612
MDRLPRLKENPKRKGTVPEAQKLYTHSEVSTYNYYHTIRTSCEDIESLSLHIDRQITSLLLCSDLLQYVATSQQCRDSMLQATQRIDIAVETFLQLAKGFQEVRSSPTMTVTPAFCRMMSLVVNEACRMLIRSSTKFVDCLLVSLQRLEDTLLRRIKTRYMNGDGTAISDQRAVDMASEVVTLEAVPTSSTLDPIVLLGSDVYVMQQALYEVSVKISGAVTSSVATRDAPEYADQQDNLWRLFVQNFESVFDVSNTEAVLRQDKEGAVVVGLMAPPTSSAVVSMEGGIGQAPRRRCSVPNNSTVNSNNSHSQMKRASSGGIGIGSEALGEDATGIAMIPDDASRRRRRCMCVWVVVVSLMVVAAVVVVVLIEVFNVIQV